MARLPRLAFAGHAHLVLLRGLGHHAVFVDDEDRRAFLTALGAVCQREEVALHGYALLRDRVWLLCTPSAADALSRAMQALGRHYTAVVNRRHARRGGLWDGRYRSAAIETGMKTLDAMIFVDQVAASDRADETAWSSASQHIGLEPILPLTDAAEYWALGNTPFDRAAAYRELLMERQSTALQQTLTASVERGWPVGSEDFLRALQLRSSRPVTPRSRGRPRKVLAKPTSGPP
jgi:REP-associated tyrosine transposase